MPEPGGPTRRRGRGAARAARASGAGRRRRVHGPRGDPANAEARRSTRSASRPRRPVTGGCAPDRSKITHGRAGSTSRSSTSTRRRPPRKAAPEHLSRAAARTTATTSSTARLRVCPQCGHHFPMRARARGSRSSPTRAASSRRPPDLRSADPLGFFDLRPYTERLAEAELDDGPRRRDGDRPRARSSGHAVRSSPSWTSRSWAARWGARSARSSRAPATRAAERGVPLVSVSASGGARMQEGILALMQLPKTVCAVEDLHDAGCALLSVLAHPTTGGVLASFASLGDVLVAEPGALMSFAGPRVVAADDAREAAGRLRPRRVEPPLRPRRRDRAAPRAAPDARPPAAALRRWRWPMRPSSGCASGSSKLERRSTLLRGARLSGELERLKRQLDRIEAEPTDEEIWRSVELARHEERPYTLDYVERLLDDWVELHGDRGARGRRGDRRRARHASTAARSRSSATRRAATSRSGRRATSAWPIPRATARRCA